MSELDDLRCKIDSLDKIIAECYAQRLDVVRSIGEYKKNNNIAVLDSGREDLVYENVKKQHPGFSKTTVYNALKALVECGFIIPITIDEERVRFDANTSFHGHFYCDVCKNIYDFETENPKTDGLNGFSVSKKNLYYSGVCPCCKNK